MYFTYIAMDRIILYSGNVLPKYLLQSSLLQHHPIWTISACNHFWKIKVGVWGIKLDG